MDDVAARLETLRGQYGAMNILLRSLYAKWAMENPEPRAFNHKFFDDMIGSMYNVTGKPENKSDVLVWEVIEDTLREFEQQVDLRLSLQTDK